MDLAQIGMEIVVNHKNSEFREDNLNPELSTFCGQHLSHGDLRVIGIYLTNSSSCAQVYNHNQLVYKATVTNLAEFEEDDEVDPLPNIIIQEHYSPGSWEDKIKEIYINNLISRFC